MTYGLCTSAFIENGGAVRAKELRRSRITAQTWTILNRERRLALIERALRPANDRIDGYPLAL